MAFRMQDMFWLSGALGGGGGGGGGGGVYSAPLTY